MPLSAVFTIQRPTRLPASAPTSVSAATASSTPPPGKRVRISKPGGTSGSTRVSIKATTIQISQTVTTNGSTSATPARNEFLSQAKMLKWRSWTLTVAGGGGGIGRDVGEVGTGD